MPSASRADVMISTSNDSVSDAIRLKAAVQKRGFSCHISAGSIADRWHAAVCKCYVPIITEQWTAEMLNELKIVQAARQLSTDPAAIVPVSLSTENHNAMVKAMLDAAQAWTAYSASPQDVITAIERSGVFPVMNGDLVVVHRVKKKGTFGIQFGKPGSNSHCGIIVAVSTPGPVLQPGAQVISVNEQQISFAQLRMLDADFADAVSLQIRLPAMEHQSIDDITPVVNMEEVIPSSPTRKSIQRLTSIADIRTRDVTITRDINGYGLSIETLRMGRHRIAEMSPEVKAAGVQLYDLIIAVNDHDVTRMSHGELTNLFSSSRGSIRLRIGESKFSSAAGSEGELKVLCCSGNIGNAEFFDLSSWIPQNGEISTSPSNFYDIIAIGMQEAVYKVSRHDNSHLSVESEASGASSIELSSSSSESEDDYVAFRRRQSYISKKKKKRKKKEKHNKDGAVRNLLSDKLTGKCSRDILGKIEEVLPGYSLVEKGRRLEMRLFVLVRDDLLDLVSNVEHDAENTGLGGVVGNKGGICIKCDLRGVSLCFVSAHLAAHRGGKYLRARNESVQQILRGVDVGMNSYDLASQFPYTFFMGDLNYRVDIKAIPKYQQRLVSDSESTLAKCKEIWDQQPEETQRWIDLHLTNEYRAEWETVMSLVNQLGDGNSEALTELLNADELNTAIKNEEVFFGWNACQPTFKPTFKVYKGVSVGHPLKYIEKRIPSYCDRVLWKALPGAHCLISNDFFESCPDFLTSDHKPVRAGFTIHVDEIEHEDKLDTQVIFTNLKAELHRDLSSDAKRDIPDPYLTFDTWPPKQLIPQSRPGHKVGPKHKVRTKHINNNRAPDWSNEAPLIGLINQKTIESNRAAHLLICLRDHDTVVRGDNFGFAALGFKELLVNIGSGNPTPFTEDLVMFGQKVGQVSGCIQIDRLDNSVPNRRRSTMVGRSVIDTVTLIGRTGKNAGINGTYTRVDFPTQTHSTSHVYRKIHGDYFLHYYAKQWRIVRSQGSIGSSKCIASIVSSDATDPADVHGNFWKIHVGGVRADDKDDSSRVWAFDRAVRIVRGEYPKPVVVGGEKEFSGTYSVVSESEYNGSWAYRKDGVHGNRTVWLQWALGEWEICVGDDRVAFITSSNPMHPPTDQYDWYICESNQKPYKSTTLVLHELTEQAPQLDRKASKSLMRGVSFSHELEETGMSTMVVPGAISIDSFEIREDPPTIVVRLRSHANIGQAIPCSFAETTDGQHRTAAINPKQSLAAGGVVQLEFPSLLDATARLIDNDDAEHARWIGSNPSGKPENLKAPSKASIRIRSVYHMGAILCSSE